MDATTFALLVELSAKARTAARLLERLDDESGPGIAVATFYRRLNGAVEQGWIEAEDAAPSGPGRPGRRYRLTPRGRREMRSEAERLRRLAAVALGGETPR